MVSTIVTAEPLGAQSRVHRTAGFWTLTLAALGVVYGDIGTSPLYAFQQSIAHVAGPHGVTRADVIGVISLMLWSLIAIVSVKYAFILLRLDNRGEGGTLSLMALVQRALGRRTLFLVIMGMLGAGLFYGDAMLTPAISVLSAVEGLEVLPSLSGHINAFVVPIAMGILMALFLVQRFGSGGVGVLFGPICVVWFVCIATLGLLHLRNDWSVVAAFNPVNAATFLLSHKVAFLVLGSVFLTVTGAEALYADMGHFGRRPIAAGWTWLVFPCLALNYLGQGALVLAHPQTLSNPFFLMAAPAWRPALVVLATMATIIASQAVISGAYSLTQQAIQLGLLPRMRILQTSARQFGQIYMPQVNFMLMLGVLYLTFAFGSSAALGSAYGVSVIGAMITSSLLAVVALWKVSKRPLWVAALVMTPFIVLELVFLGANLLKIFSGGIVPLLLACGFIVIMWTWVRGSQLLQQTSRQEATLAGLLETLALTPPKRVRGTGIFLTADPQAAPTALLHNLKHNQVLHENVVLLTIKSSPLPRARDEERVTIEQVRDDLHLLTLTFGFMETPNVSRGLALARARGLPFDIMTTSFFLSRRALVAKARSKMPRWQDLLFIFLARNATSASDFFHIPTARVVELGTQVSI